jgi:hypothetical protein
LTVILCIVFAILVIVGGWYVAMEVNSVRAESICVIITVLCAAAGIWFFTHLAPAPTIINIGSPDTSIVITITDGQVAVQPRE